MFQYLISGILIFSSLGAFASTECEIVDLLKVVPQMLCENSTGSVFHANGKYAGTKGESWYYSNGSLAGSIAGYWYHSNTQYAGSVGRDWYHSIGTYAGSYNESWYHPDGKYAGINEGSWYAADGSYRGNFSNMSETDQLKMVLQ